MSLEVIRELYDYHRWANRRLFDVATTLGEEVVSRDPGKQFSYRSSAGCSVTSSNGPSSTGWRRKIWSGSSSSATSRESF